MKGCLLLQRRFAFINHELAALLKDKYGIEQFCGYVFLRSSYEFLKQQSDIAYTDLLLDEDIHEQYKTEKLDLDYLRRLEKEYGIPNLWPYIAVDRILMFNQLLREYPYNTPHYTHEEMLRILQVTARAIINFLEKEKPDFVIISAIGSVGGYLLYEIAKKKGIKILHILASSLKHRFSISERYDFFTDTEKIFAENLRSRGKKKYYLEAKTFLGAFRETPHAYNEAATPERQPIERKKQLDFLKPKNLLRSVSWFLTLIKEYATTRYRYDYSYIHPWDYLKDRVKRKIRNAIGAQSFYDQFNPKEQFAFFPLHFEPEVSLLLLAPFMTNQLYLIRQIARSLPVGYTLCVKEHPLMVPYRPRAYYKELKKIPNVKLLPPDIKSWDIIPHAKLIFTITGSVGWEATVLKKPVIAFGNQFYNPLSTIKRAREIEQLPYLVKEQLENFTYNDEELTQFTAAILEDTALVPLFYLWEEEADRLKKRKGLEPLADFVAKKLGLNKQA